VKVAEIKAAPPPATDEIRASTTDATRSEGADS
jgi:hypothetical protein